MNLKTYWHILTLIANYITTSKGVKFTKEELHTIFKYVYKVESVTKLTDEEWGEYIVNIITGSLCVLDIPEYIFASNPRGVQWTNTTNEN